MTDLLAQDLTLRNLVGRKTTGGTAEETLNLSLDGAVAAASIAVPAGTIFAMSDISVILAAASIYKIQQSIDAGSNWFDVFIGRFAAGASRTISLKSPIEVVGGADVLIRGRVQTPGGAALAGVTIGVVSQP